MNDGHAGCDPVALSNTVKYESKRGKKGKEIWFGRLIDNNVSSSLVQK